MAYNLNPSVRNRTHTFLSEPVQFQRGRGKTKTKKIQRKIRLRFMHILFYLILIGGIFYALQQAYLFLISWDKLDIKDVIVGLIQEKFTAHRWIKEVRVRKILHSSLKIEIKERTPVALLKQDHTYMIDEDGVFLEKIEQGEKANLPLLIDSNNFKKDYEEKLNLAWECLRSLAPSEKERFEVLDLTEYENVIVRLKNNQTRLILGNDRFSEKISLYRRLRAKLERFGDLEYVDLRLHDRIYIKPKRNIAQRNFIPNANKEAF